MTCTVINNYLYTTGLSGPTDKPALSGFISVFSGPIPEKRDIFDD